MSGPDGTVHTLRTLVDLLAQRAVDRGDAPAFTFSRDGDEQDNVTASYRDLHRRARQIAVHLQRQGAAASGCWCCVPRSGLHRQFLRLPVRRCHRHPGAPADA